MTIEREINIQALQAGDRAAFAALMTRYDGLVYNTCLGFVQNAEDAQDVAQDVFVEVFRTVKHFRSEAKLSTWLYRIAVSLSLSFLRKRRAKKRFGFMQSLFDGSDEGALELPDEVHPGILAENKDRARVLMAAIGQLAIQQQVAFTLHKVEGLPYQEIAEVMDVSLSAVESLIYRARQNLQKKLRHYYEQELI